MANYFNDTNMDFWAKNNLNVLLRGKHGVGKTARILECFKRNNLKCQYFSASTLDPFVDFIGIPKDQTRNDGTHTLELIRPSWQDNDVDVIFLDEYNRAPKKVRNAVMELIQFKSINGRKFPNLKMVWAAINPEDDDSESYDVDALDPAQMDRFQIIVEVPYEPEASYFRGKYGKRVADIALGWWNDTLKPTEKKLVSPRRLDYALEVWKLNGHVKAVFHPSINIQALMLQLKNGPLSETIEKLFESKDIDGARKFMALDNNVEEGMRFIAKSPEMMNFFGPLLNHERLTVLMAQEKQVEAHVFKNFDVFETTIRQLAKGGTGALAHAALKIVNSKTDISTVGDKVTDWSTLSKVKTPDRIENCISSLRSLKLNSTSNRNTAYASIRDVLPSPLPNTPTIREVFGILAVCLTKTIRPVKDVMPDLLSMLWALQVAIPDWNTCLGEVDEGEYKSRLVEVSNSYK